MTTGGTGRVADRSKDSLGKTRGDAVANRSRSADPANNSGSSDNIGQSAVLPKCGEPPRADEIDVSEGDAWQRTEALRGSMGWFPWNTCWNQGRGCRMVGCSMAHRFACFHSMAEADAHAEQFPKQSQPHGVQFLIDGQGRVLAARKSQKRPTGLHAWQQHR